MIQPLLTHTDFLWKLHWLPKKEVRQWQNKYDWKLAKVRDSSDQIPSFRTLKQEFKDSNLYSGYNDIDVEDALEATYQNTTHIKAGELHVTERKGRNSRSVFRGVMATISLERPFEGKTFASLEGDRVYTSHGSRASKSEETLLEWNDFENLIKVHTTHPREAREIFTTDFMVAIYDWWNEHKKFVRFSFIGSKIYIALPTEILFEPRAGKDVTGEKDALWEYYDFILFVERVTKLVIYHQRLKFSLSSLNSQN